MDDGIDLSSIQWLIDKALENPEQNSLKFEKLESCIHFPYEYGRQNFLIDPKYRKYYGKFNMLNKYVNIIKNNNESLYSEKEIARLEDNYKKFLMYISFSTISVSTDFEEIYANKTNFIGFVVFKLLSKLELIIQQTKEDGKHYGLIQLHNNIRDYYEDYISSPVFYKTKLFHESGKPYFMEYRKPKKRELPEHLADYIPTGKPKGSDGSLFMAVLGNRIILASSI